MSDLPIQQPVADTPAEASAAEACAGLEPGADAWSDLRQRLLAALNEDPANAAMLARHLDHRDAGLLDPWERALATLAGLRPGPGAARRLLEAALAQPARPEGPVQPLRLALLGVLLHENRRRTEPWLLEMRMAPAPVSGRVADPAHAATDFSVLTGAIQDELRRARRFGQECALIRLALDDWHELAWRAGPAAAERALTSVAMVINNEIRDVDWTARTAEGDLLVFLAGTGRLGAVLVANRLAAKVGDLSLPGVGAGERAAVSMGVVAFPDDARFGKDLLAAARRALFRARADGGNAISDQGREPERRLLRVSPDRVRVVVRALPAHEAPAEDTGGGLLFTSPVPYEVGSGVELECIEVAGSGQARLRGRVVLLESRRQGRGFDVGVACALSDGAAELLQPRSSRQAR